MKVHIGSGTRDWSHHGSGCAAGAIVLFITVAFLTAQGCYHTRIIASDSPATDYEKHTMYALAWGLVQTNVLPDSCHCPSNALAEVRYSSNLGYSLITVITLGFWSPVEVEWRCAKMPAPQPHEQ